MYEVKAYHCSFCKKHGLTKSNIKKHEFGCFRNPITRSCATCANYTQKENDVHSQFSYESTPICLDGISMFEQASFMDDAPKVKLHTACSKWVERPEDEIELAKYQYEKQEWELIVLNPEII